MHYFNTHTHFSFDPLFEILQSDLGLPNTKFHSAGVHPWNAESYISTTIEEFIKIIDSKQLLAIGEIGLDKLKGPEIEQQIEVFITQIKVSEKLELPTIIHCVKAWNELKMIKKSINPSQTWIYHGFAQAAIVHEVINQGMMISLGSAIMHHPKNQEIIDAIPDNRILIETDDRKIEIIEIYRIIAQLKKISLLELTTIVAQNFKNTFHKWQIG